MMIDRTKLYHGLSNEAFNPQDYSHVDSIDMAPDYPCSEWEIKQRIEWAVKIGRDSKTTLGATQCSHCGQHLRYAHILLHRPTGDYLSVGRNCIERFSHKTRLDVIQAHTRLQYAALDGRARKKAQAFIEDNPGLIEGFQEVLSKINDRFIQSLLDQFENKHKLSARQVEVGYSAIERGKAKIAENEKIQSMGEAAPIGRADITGVIKSCRFTAEPGRYGGYNYSGKMLVEVEANTPYRVWTTIPEEFARPNSKKVGVGMKVNLRVTLVQNDTKPDPLFRIGSRPSCMSVLKEEVTVC